MQKSPRKLAIGIISIMTVIMIISSFAMINRAYAVDIQPPVSMWIDPSSINYTTATVPVGGKFNVTVWVNTQNATVNETILTWQITLAFNETVLTCTRAGYTGGGTSQFFTGLQTVPVSPVITANSIAFGETVFSGGAAGNGSLCWIEFQTNIGPNETIPTLTSDLNFTGLPTSDTFVLKDDGSGGLIAVEPFMGYNATLYYSLPPADTIPPTIGTVTRDPSGAVVENNSVVVTAEITDNIAVAGAILSWTTDNVTWTNETMVLFSGNLWSASILGQLKDTTVGYFINASDTSGNIATTSGSILYYTVVPEYTFAILMVMLTILAAAIVAFRKKLVKLP